ncbi:FG-GAP-like repeat-containing protein [Maribacter halichondriae]|uniref:FG-GAP-like repeat-containing protein n=1 Tax=Maribacter halichondriae TaxID=2980554 RepID=UPI0023593EDB|nr:FG-GAP-like repeat-containing protein [Maribacter sp. Hal144]
MGGGSFLEVGRQTNVAATEWSWGALLFDMDNDGLRDIFISNGIYKDLLDRDYLTYDADEETVRNRIKNNQKNAITGLIDAMPSQPVPNAAFKNLGAFDFENDTEDWGLNEPSFSNGSAYGDLDNDGDLDLVVNNVNMPSFIYENKTDTLTHRGTTLKFIQQGKNTNAIGVKAKIKYGDYVAYGENFASRGFQSSVANGIHFGVGKTQTIDTLWITWPDGTTSYKTNLATNQVHIVQKLGSIPQSVSESALTKSSVAEPISSLFDFGHDENEYIDFNNERLLPQMFSNEGPALASGDINNDGVPDFFIGGAKNQSGALFISSGESYSEITAPFYGDIGSEDTDALFFDGDNDGDLDLYVCHGGKAFSPYSTALNDSFYENDDGNFSKVKSTLGMSAPISSSVVKAEDYDQDGDLDLFVGERYKPNLYGQPGSGFLLENDGKGNFAPIKNVALVNIGMITDAHWADINNDGWHDLILVGEWMGIKIFINTAGELTDKSENFGLGDTSGLWTALEVSDVDGDGDEDLIAGNLGLNNFFEPDMRMYISDFDGNGFQEQIICKKKDSKYYPIVDKDELISQIPALKKKLLYYKDYAQADMQSIFSTQVLEKASVLNIKILESSVFYNKEGKFVRQGLPHEIQYAPVYEIVANDIDADGNLDLLFGGNQHSVKPQFGRYDASKGWAIFGPHLKDDVQSVKNLGIEGQIRGIKCVDYKGQKIILVARNNDKTVFYKISKDQ